MEDINPCLQILEQNSKDNEELLMKAIAQSIEVTIGKADDVEYAHESTQLASHTTADHATGRLLNNCHLIVAINSSKSTTK